MCVIKQAHLRWVFDPAGAKRVEEAKIKAEQSQTQLEREQPAIKVSLKSQCGAITPGRRPR